MYVSLAARQSGAGATVSIDLTWTVQWVAMRVKMEHEAAHTEAILVHKLDLHLRRCLGIQLHDARPCTAGGQQLSSHRQ